MYNEAFYVDCWCLCCLGVKCTHMKLCCVFGENWPWCHYMSPSCVLKSLVFIHEAGKKGTVMYSVFWKWESGWHKLNFYLFQKKFHLPCPSLHLCLTLNQIRTLPVKRLNTPSHFFKILFSALFAVCVCVSIFIYTRQDEARPTFTSVNMVSHVWPHVAHDSLNVWVWLYLHFYNNEQQKKKKMSTECVLYLELQSPVCCHLSVALCPPHLNDSANKHREKRVGLAGHQGHFKVSRDGLQLKRKN